MTFPLSSKRKRVARGKQEQAGRQSELFSPAGKPFYGLEKRIKPPCKGLCPDGGVFQRRTRLFLCFFYLGNCWVNSPQSLINKGIQRLRESFDSRQGHQKIDKFRQETCRFLFKSKGVVCNHGLPCMELPSGVCHFGLMPCNSIELIAYRFADYIHATA